MDVWNGNHTIIQVPNNLKGRMGEKKSTVVCAIKNEPGGAEGYSFAVASLSRQSWKQHYI